MNRLESRSRTRFGGMKTPMVECQAIDHVKVRIRRKPRKRRESTAKTVQRWAHLLWQEAPELIYWGGFMGKE